MLRKVALLLVSILFSVTAAFSQVGTGSVKGKVTDAVSGDPIGFANVVAFQNGIQKGYARTDFEGQFQISSLPPGEYDVIVQVVNYPKYTKSGVVINSDNITFLNNISLSSKVMKEVVVIFEEPIVKPDGGSSGGKINRETIENMAARSVSEIAGTVAGVNNTDGGVSVRGARPGSNSTYYYIDGIKVRGSASLPKSAIEEVAVITGGVPANYGDVTGGIISITTRGPSANYFGSIEGVTSGFYFKGKDPNGYDGKSIGLDKFAYNLVEGMISGPILMKKDSAGNKTDEPILGFFLSANYRDQLDPRPVKNGTYRIKKSTRDALLANPLRPTGTGLGTYYNANFLQASDFEKTAYRMNARNRSARAAGKLDINVGKFSNLTFGGSMVWSKGSSYSYQNSLLNFTNFGQGTSLDWRVYGKFTQRFMPKREKGSTSKIKSASYTIMVDYSKTKATNEDPNYGSKLFNYGYVGKFKTYRRPTYALNSTSDTLVHNGFKDYLVEFTPSEVNQAFASVTRQYYDIYAGKPINHYENLFQVQQGNALRNGDQPDNVYGIWGNLGTPYNFYGKSETSQFRVTGSGSINIGDHRITLGFEFEQRVDRGFQSGRLGPITLWTIARQYLNSHIKELDVNKPTYDNYNGFHRVTYDRLNSGYGATNGVYGGQQNGDQQTFFDYNVRKKLGYDPFGTDYINLDEIDPNQLSLDMFSPDELANSGNTFFQYWGYDYTGKKVKGKTDINSYFNDFDKNGNYKRFVGAFQPLYIAGYIMDKFAFDDIVFNVGVRVDIFNANQPMLKDPFLLYNARTAKDARALASSDPGKYGWANIPTSVGDDYTVYVNDVKNPTSIKGFRSGNQWYNASGVPVADPALIVGGNGIAPWLLDPTAKTPSGDAFTKYKAQINVMPRIAFSFPVSDKSNFFAHYDILTKRPTSGFRFNPLDYQFMAVRNVIVNNPALKPQKTISYEFGFQQALSRKSAIKISAFYTEQRNMIQLMGVYEAYPRTYRTYGNRDFGTVKGVSFEYELRRTGNVQLRVNYTLQFANGTGSSSTSALSLVNSGQPNLQNIFPYSYDQRHKFNIVFDYRYGSGKNYNGPTTKKGGQILKNTGLNIIANIGSGTPYSRQQTIMAAAFINPSNSGLQGTLNGSRKPWQYSLDLQIDRTFDIKMGKKDKDGNRTKTGHLNVYFRITNILNTGNILNVYRSTGNPDDDGYLAAAKYQTSIQNQLDEQAFRNYYAMKVNNPFNISTPRTIRLGVKFDF